MAERSPEEKDQISHRGQAAARVAAVLPRLADRVLPTIEQVQDAVEPVAGVKQVNVGRTFDPPWGMEMMSDEARLELGFM